MPATPSDHALAHRLAAQAGELLVDLRERLTAEGVSGPRLKDEGDRAAHELLMMELAAAAEDDAVLSEEGKDDPIRLSSRRVWIVDPLDGTREFGEPGRTDWAVHVALWSREASAPSGDLIAGAVSLPAQDRVLLTVTPMA